MSLIVQYENAIVMGFSVYLSGCKEIVQKIIWIQLLMVIWDHIHELISYWIHTKTIKLNELYSEAGYLNVEYWMKNFLFYRTRELVL